MKNGTTRAGIDIYEKETATGTRVFTLRAARMYNLDALQMVIDYMLETKKLDPIGHEKAAYSFRNVMKAMKEKSVPPTEEELKTARTIYEEIQTKHRDLEDAYKGEKE